MTNDAQPSRQAQKMSRSYAPLQAVVIGASAGGVQAVVRILSKLPKKIAVPIIVMIHLPEESKSLLPEVLSPSTSISLRELEDKDSISGGQIYTAPPGYHTLIERGRTFALTTEAPVNFSRPSIDVLFESAAEVYGRSLAAVLLTGASADGAMGLKRIKELGGLTVVQDPKSADVGYMPESALRLVSPELVLNLDEIAEFIAEISSAGLKQEGIN